MRKCTFLNGSKEHTINSRRGFSDEMMVQPRKHLGHISDTHSSSSGRREAELALELNVVGLLETKPLLVREQRAEAAVAKSNSLIGTKLLRFESILCSPVETRAQLVEAGGRVREIDTDPLFRGIGAGA